VHRCWWVTSWGKAVWHGKVGLHSLAKAVQADGFAESSLDSAGVGRLQKRGALRMKLGVGWQRGLGALCLVLGLSVGVFAAAVVAPSFAVAQTASSIVVEGNRRVEADTIRSYFTPRPGERVDAAKIDQALKALYKTGLFQDVRINQAGGRLVVTVVENQVINRVAFEGNKKVKDDQLTTEVQSKARGTLSRPMVQADVQRIVEIYRRNGRFDVRVTPQIIELPNNRVDLVFEINEGEKTVVKEINFVGNNAYSTSRLKDVIKTAQSNLLSFLQSNDIYDPDRLEADRDLIRKFYLTHGYADIRVVSAVAEYDPAHSGFVVTFTVDEGEQYHFGRVDAETNVGAIDVGVLRSRLRVHSGDVYNAELIEKTVEDLTVEASRRGYAFASARPRGDRDYTKRLVNVTFVIEEGARAYIERINIRGNTRTRDYVLRREFDLSEGDPYNRALVDRAERRLKNLNYFKTVKITNEPGSAPDRIVLNVDVEEQSTGEFSIAGGYSTADGAMAEVSIGERNLLGQGQYAKAAVTYGQYSKGVTLSFAEPYFLGNRLTAGIDLYARATESNSYLSYGTEMVGGAVRLGFALTENLSMQFRYSAYMQEIQLPTTLANCNNINPDFINTFPTPAYSLLPGSLGSTPATTAPAASPNAAGQTDCFADGESSVPVKMESRGGPVYVSMPGYTLAYNALDNNKRPTGGLYGELRQDFAGAGGDVAFIRTSGDIRQYYEVVPDFVAVVHLQAGNLSGYGNDDNLRMLDMFKLGPDLVRGFAPAGIGPRDTTLGTTNDALGGTNYWGASLEVQVPFYFLPKDVGMRGAVYTDAGSLWGYKGPTYDPLTNVGMYCNGAQPSTTTPTSLGNASNCSGDPFIRSSVGVGLIWDSPFGPLRFDLAYPLTKEPWDHTQIFRFGGGTKF
jgi:outer membrane protein insertion porin family